MKRSLSNVEDSPVWWAERWRVLTPEQRQYVFSALRWAHKRARVACEQAREKGSRPEPFGRHQRERAITHASNMGAFRIARGLLKSLGGFP